MKILKILKISKLSFAGLGALWVRQALFSNIFENNALFDFFGSDEKQVAMASLAKRKEVAAMHQFQGLPQTAILKKTFYYPKLVHRWKM